MEKSIYKYVFNGVNISKRDYELMQFIQTGSNDFVEAYFVYENRKIKTYYKSIQFYASWFNRTLKRIQKKGLLKEIPFVYGIDNVWVWSNPGINASAANFECITLHDAQMEMKSEINKILV